MSYEKIILPHALKKAGAAVRSKFVAATVNFAIIAVFIQLFQKLFGAENTVVAIILTILMGIWANQGFTAKPLRSFVSQTLVLAAMACAACISVAFGPWVAIPINLAVAFPLLYRYTYEYAGHLYFPYILSYLFLLFISPVPLAKLPLRLASVAAGAACMAVYAVVAGWIHTRLNARAYLKEAAGEALDCISCLKEQKPLPDDAMKMRKIVYRLSSLAQQGAENAIALLDAGRGMETLTARLHRADTAPSEAALGELERALNACLKPSESGVPVPDQAAFKGCEDLYEPLAFILNKVTEAKARKRADKPPLKERWRRAFEYSPVRLAYAVRVSLLLALFILPVQALHLPHGKWLVFTLASVSLPYAEDVSKKGLKRIAATLLGGCVALVCFSLIPNATARTALMMFSGYLSFYFADYLGNYACATFGALGGAAVYLYGWADVGTVFGIRIAYIAVGVGIAFAANLLLCPFRRRKASERIFEKYDATARLLSDSRTLADRRAYYELVIHNNLLEEKLLENAAKAGENVLPHVKTCRENMCRAQSGRL